jgi:replicative DNA helicase
MAIEFNDDFKNKVLALQLRDNNFCQRTDGLVQPSFFDSEIDRYIMSITTNHYTKYSTVPSPVAVSQTFKEDQSKGIVRKELVSSISSKLKELYKAEVSDREFVVEKIADFARTTATEKAVLQAADILDSGGDITSIMGVIQKALDVGSTDLATAIDYKETIEKRTEIRKARLKGEISYNSVTTGWKDFDNILYRRGWGKGELTMYMAPSKGGKSVALVDHALRAVEKGFNVLLISLEVSTEIQVDRMDSNISGVKMGELSTFIDKVSERVTKWRTRASNLKCHEYPSGTYKVSDLRRLIKKYQATGLTFDLVVVDYADIMLSESRSHETIDKSKQVLIDLRGLAQTENLAILTATQTNRAGAAVKGDDVISDIHVAEDFNKIRIADLVISINCNDIERDSGEARLYFAASRNQPAYTITVKRDLSIMKHIKEILEIK